MAKLKVYRTPAGFHDAYVAAPSQKAALAAWGSDADLFARGIAAVVTDPALTEAPLARPGEIIRVARTAADTTDDPPPVSASTPAKKRTVPARRRAKRPSRRVLDAAEHALTAAEARHREESAAIRREEAALAKRRRTLDKAQAAERAKLDRARIRARDAYDAALTTWEHEGKDGGR